MDQIKELLQQINKNPTKGDLHNSVGRLYQQRGDTTEAIKHFLAAARLFSGVNSPSRNVNKALAILRKVIRDFPTHKDSYYLLAEILQEMEHQEEAVDVYKALSDLYRQEGKYLMAVSVFDKAISANPDDQESWIRFAELNRDAGMPFHAAQAFVKAAGLGLEARKGEPPANLVVQALILDPENAEALELFRNLSRRGKTGQKQELEILELAEEVDRNGQYDQALDLLDILKNTRLKEKARAVARRVKAHSGIEEETREKKDLGDRKSLSRKFEGTPILVVDDEREILLLLEQILSGEGFRVFTANDGEEGLEVYLRERPPLVVTDAMLPKLHGFELCHKIKLESNNATKVMILTAVYKKYKYKGKVQEEYNVDEYLDKPFQITEFLQAIYKMAESIKEVKHADPDPGEKVRGEDLPKKASVLVAVHEDTDLAPKVMTFCERNGLSFFRAKDAKELFWLLQEGKPDVLLFSDPFAGLDTDAIGPLLRNILDNHWTTLVMVTKNRARIEGPAGLFDHRIVAPVSNSVLENVVNLHRSSHRFIKDQGRKAGAFDERRLESVLRSKVERILKSHSQLEEFFSTRVRELEEENLKLKKELFEKENNGD